MAAEHTDGTRSDPLRYLSAITTAFGLVVAGFLVANLIVVPLVPVLSAFDLSIRSTPGYVGSTLLQNVGFAAVVFAYIRYADVAGLFDVRWPSLSHPRRLLRDLGWVLVGFVLLVAASQAVSILLQGIGLAPGTNRIVSAVRADPTLALYLIALSFLATGPGEEILFRGGVQGILRRVFSPVPAVLLSSALFGIAHATATIAASGLAGAGGYVVSTFLLGLILGGLYEYTDNLLVPALIHGAYNAVTFAQLYALEALSFHPYF
ncbi:CPBP family intramembrane glutamic endopeptidase [Halococcus hamelinensis]|uniref:CAAX prenyl protease 2/Lysostaphin resistance protein A-like domain-containing protein n=1 Tax=Halococcus hamelinensis 100A6 TaxID=1132509 RepID=M0M7U6_9EURY|nr:CPBP family intramembrane glutamic endopeptidase [Halococcus hamelinensis]EMA40689.1 hypothetical protein C447_04186 [Halococcus hamelinensis 100A6]